MNIKLMASVAALALTTSACMMNDGMAMNDDQMAMDNDKTQVAYIDGAAMYSNKTIVENAVNSPVHKTLVRAVQAADLVDTLNGRGPFTVFAPTDEAFSRVPQSLMSTLMMPANKAMLQGALKYHVVPGRITAADLMSRIKAGNGTATITTVQGQPLTFKMMNGNVMITGASGSSAYVTQADLMQSNGVIHVVNGVLVPTM